MIDTQQDEIYNKDRLDGVDLRAMISSAVNLLEANMESINELNVFPVADGDTGTNIYFTLRDSVAGTLRVDCGGADEVSRALADAALGAAKGNSGVILSQFLEGLAIGLKDGPDFDCRELVYALKMACSYSYKAVGNPVEGTMLTVIAAVANAATDFKGSPDDIIGLLDVACNASRESVALTPTKLDVLKEAGVVDAGGQGIAVILEGARRYLAGEIDTIEIKAPDPIGVDNPTGSISKQFLDAAAEEKYGFCTQFLLQAENVDIEALRDKISSMGESDSVVGNNKNVQVHVHTQDPDAVIIMGSELGVLSQVKAENMDDQHAQFAGDPGFEDGEPSVELGVVVVGLGSGFRAIFSELGAIVFAPGADTINPSVDELLFAINSVPYNSVIVLPNNSNIMPAAVQAAKKSDKDVRVLPTQSIPQGVAVMSGYFDAMAEIDTNMIEMEQAVESIRSGAVTEAVRTVTLNGLTIEPGMMIGFLDNKLVAANQELEIVVQSLLEIAGPDKGDLVALYWGGDLTPDEAKRICDKMSKVFDGVDIHIYKGGQPSHPFLLSIE